MNETTANTDSKFLRKTSFVSGLLTWLVVFVTFVRVLGGFHPSDAVRDRVVGIAAGLIAVLSVPTILLIGQRIRHRQAARLILIPAFFFLIRIVVAILALRFVQRISHDGA